MLNVSSEAAGIGAGVLLRALEPLCRHRAHAARPRRLELRDLARGPGRLAAPWASTCGTTGCDLFRPGALWIGSDGAAVDAIGESVRIGLTKGAEARLSFFVAAIQHLSGSRRLNARWPTAYAAGTGAKPNPLADRLAEGSRHSRFVMLDGALATELERRGVDLRDPLWSAKCLIEPPEIIRAVHLDYFKAGAQVATTATYQATFEGFRGRGIGRDRPPG